MEGLDGGEKESGGRRQDTHLGAEELAGNRHNVANARGKGGGVLSMVVTVNLSLVVALDAAVSSAAVSRIRVSSSLLTVSTASSMATFSFELL